MTTISLGVAGSGKCIPLSVITAWILYSTASKSAFRKSAATRCVAFSCTSTKANFEVGL
jgi:hypothetical protein